MYARSLTIACLALGSALPCVSVPAPVLAPVERCVASRGQPDARAALLAKTQALGQLAQQQPDVLVSGREAARDSSYALEAESARVLKLDRAPETEERYELGPDGQTRVCVRVRPRG